MVGAGGAVLVGAAAELAPDLDQHAVVLAARLEVALEGQDRIAGAAQVVAERVLLVGVGVVAARGRDRHRRQGHPAADHLGQAREPLAEAGVGVGHRRGVALKGGEQLAQVVGLRRRATDLGHVGGVRGEAPEAPEGVVHRLDHRVADAVRVHVVVGDVLDSRHRHRRGRDRWREGAVHGQALQRVVVRARAVDVAPEPAGPRADLQLPDLVEVAGGEVRLVGAGVADRREGRDLALGVQGRKRGRGRVPAHRGVLAEGRALARPQRQRRAQSRVLGVPGRGQHAHRVDAAVEEDRDQDAPVGGCVGDPVVECGQRQLAGAVDRQRQSRAARDERAPREPGAGRDRHPVLDHRQALAGLGRRGAHQRRAGVVAAAVVGGHRGFAS